MSTNFNVYTITKLPKNGQLYCHWATGLSMVIHKNGKTITLTSEEIQSLVKSLPQTMGGSY